jgi:hypothetical protein
LVNSTLSKKEIRRIDPRKQTRTEYLLNYIGYLKEYDNVNKISKQFVEKKE